MTEKVNVKIKNDKSVDRVLRKTSREIKRSIKKSYETINEKHLLENQTKLQKVLSRSLNVVSILFVIFGVFLCFCGTISRIQNIPPSFAGYSTMIVSSESMEKSGFFKGDGVVVKYTNAESLQRGDIIAFYVEYPSAYNVKSTAFTLVDDSKNETKTTLTFGQFFGVQPKEIRTVAKSNNEFVFHHIDSIYVDENGQRWFTTYGSSNGYTDPWCINEAYVVGKHDNSFFGAMLSKTLSLINDPILIGVFIFLPLIILSFSIVKDLYKMAMVLRLENEVLYGRRKLTDSLCLRLGVGYKMSKKQKMKVLATAPENLKSEYIALLWKDGTAPASIRKHYLRKTILMNCYRESIELEKTCKLMASDGVEESIIVQHYIKEKDRIKQKEKRYKELMKKLKVSKSKEVKGF